MNPTNSHDADLDTTKWVTVHFVRGTRYYRLHLEQDLWGTWCLTRVNGRTGTPLGCAATLGAGTRHEGLATLAAAAVRRFRRGYHFVLTN